MYEKDVIQTGADGAIGITFTDNTVMSTGPNSEVSLEEYRFDSSNFNGAMLTDMRKGTLAMVSGDIARSTPGAMKVKTPTAILGVRGTRFAVQVEGDALIVRRVTFRAHFASYVVCLREPAGTLHGASKS